MINLTVVIDNDEALKKLKELQKVAKQSTSSVVSDAERMDSAFNSVKGSIAELAGAAALGSFVNKVIQVRGEVQQLEVAFETMLGSKAKAEALMADVINLAAKTPFGLQDVSNATKMLLAYGSTAESVADEIKMLGNIASGLSIPLNDMIYLYGTTRTQGRMFTQDLRQFMGRGIPLAEELAKQFRVNKDEVGALVTAGKVGFPEMQKALQSMTSEGGQFFNLMEKQSQTITGQISNLEDSIYQMFNAIGESQQGTISKGISLASSLVENYEKVIDVIAHLIIVYGAYKAAVMAVAAAQTVASMVKMVKTMYDLAKGAQTAAAAFNLLKGSTRGWVGLITGVLSSIGILMMDFSDTTEEAVETMGELEQAARDEQMEVNKLVYKLQQANIGEGERATILERLKEIAPSIVEGIDNESAAIDNLKERLDEYNSSQIKRIQLAALNDRQSKALNDYATADLAYTEYSKAVEERMAKLVAEYTTKGLPDVKFNYDRENALPHNMRASYEKRVKERIAKALEQAASGEINGVKLAEALRDIARGTGVDIVGVNEDLIGSKLSKLYWDREAKRKNLEKSTANVDDLRTLLGISEGGENKSRTSSNNEIQYLEAKRAAYKAWIEELKKLQAIERGEVKATEEAWKTQKKKEEEARKAYEALGGSTKQQTPKPPKVEKKETGNSFQNALKWIDEFIAEAVDKAKDYVKDSGESWDEYLIQFGTFQERWDATQRKYDREIKHAQTVGERKALEAERDAALAAFEVQAGEWAKDLANKSQAGINRLLKELQEQVDAKQAAFDALDSSDSQEAKDYQKTINELNAKIAHLKTLVKDTGEEVKKDNWAEATQVFQNISSTAKEAASALSEMNPALGEIFSGLANIAEIGGDAVSALRALSTAASAVDKASAVLMVISVVIKAISTITSGVTKTIREHEEAMFALTQVAQQYKLALEDIAFQEGRMAFSSIFADDKFGEFNALIEKANEYKAALEDVREEANKPVDYGRSWSQSETQDWRMRAAAGVFFDNSKLIADMRSGWQKFVGSSKNIEVTALDEFYENGVLNIEKLKAYYDNYKDYLSKEQQLLVEKLIAAGEQYEEASQAVADYLTDIFGDFGETMTDILVDSFNEGTDAALEFGDAMADIIDRLTKEFIYSAFIKDFVDAAQAQVEALNEEDISGEERVKRLVGILKQLSNDVLGAQDEVNATLEQLESEGYGVDRSSGQQSASSGGFQTMSQETGSELNGRFTDIQGKVTYINEAVQFMKSLSASQLQQTTSISETVALIRNDTTRIEQHTRVLGQMAADIASIKSDISNGGY